MTRFSVLYISLICLLTSCTQKINLSYESVIEKCEKNNIDVVINSFEDNRKSARLGSIRNFYGMPIIKLVTDDNITQWVTNALKLEMENAGYMITDHCHGNAYEIGGKLIKAYTTSYLLYHGRMMIEVIVKKGEEEIFRKTYMTKENNGINWLSSGYSCSKTLTINLQKIFKQFIFDFNQLK